MLRTFVLNLDRSIDRMEAMHNAFPYDKMERISGVDGRIWESGEYAVTGQPLFKPEIKQKLIDSGDLSEETCEDYIVTPGEMAMCLGYKKIWQKIVDEDLSAAIILEDDIQPCGAALNKSLSDCFEIPDDADTMLLTGPDKMFNIEGIDMPFTALTATGLVMVAFGSCAYAITNAGARKALSAVTPLKYHLARQWWITSFSNTKMFVDGLEKNEDAGLLYGVRNALVEHSVNATVSEVTKNGGKPWRVLHF